LTATLKRGKEGEGVRRREKEGERREKEGEGGKRREREREREGNLFEYLVVGFGGEEVEIVEGGALATGGETVGFDSYSEEG
jgi:hypothetical protein